MGKLTMIMIGLAMIMVYDTTIVDEIYNPTYPLVMSKQLLKIYHLIIVYLPIQNGDFQQLCKRLPEGKYPMQKMHFIYVIIYIYISYKQKRTKEHRMKSKKITTHIFQGIYISHVVSRYVISCDIYQFEFGIVG